MYFQETEPEEEDFEDLVAEASDSDIPEGVDLNDPYFKEEMDKMDKEGWMNLKLIHALMSNEEKK